MPDKRCACGSWAINLYSHGRKSYKHKEQLCDVCYWRSIANIAIKSLLELHNQTEKDCPTEYRTKHLKAALLEANDIIDAYCEGDT